MKNIIIIIVSLLFIGIINTTGQITETGISDNFSSTNGPTKKSSLINQGCDNNSFACYNFSSPKDSINENYSIATTRDTISQKMTLDMFKDYANYHTYNFTFGSVCSNNVIIPLSLDLTNNSILSFGIELIDKYSVDTTQGIYLEIHLKDINGKILNYDKKVIENLNYNWQYWIGITHSTPNNIDIGFDKEKFLPVDGLISFSYDFNKAWSSDKAVGGMPDDFYDFDISQVVELGFLFRSSHLNCDDHCHSYPIKISVDVSDFSLGKHELTELGTTCNGDVVLGENPKITNPQKYRIDHLNKAIILTKEYREINIFNLKGESVSQHQQTDRIETNDLSSGLYLLKTESFSTRIFLK